MRKIVCLAVVALSAAVVSQVAAKNAASKTIKEVMDEGHKAGKPPLCGKAKGGKATKEEVEKLVILYEALPGNKPPKGDEAAWKKKCEALIAATKKLAADPTDKAAVAAYGKAVACGGCHSEHK